MYEKRLADGFYLYCLLDLQRRYGIPLKFYADIDQTLDENVDVINTSLRKCLFCIKVNIPIQTLVFRS
jgi:hypothetical protein